MACQVNSYSFGRLCAYGLRYYIKYYYITNYINTTSHFSNKLNMGQNNRVRIANLYTYLH